MPIAKLKSYQPRVNDPLIAIIFSIVLFSVLTVYPLSYALSGWRPHFMFMIMLFWVMCQPTWCGVWFAFSLGLFTDLLLDMPLGLNALCFVLVAFISRYLTRERRIMTFTNLWTINVIAITVYLIVIYLLQIVGGVEFIFARHWQPLISTIFIWPIMYYFLRRWRI